jgi:predicted nucleic acid-binding protein
MYSAFFDTCVLYKSYLCDTILTLAESNLFRLMWSDDVLYELDRNLRTRIASQHVAHRLHQMRVSFPDANVENYANLIPAMTNHPKDRHVLAAALKGRADALVTENLRDFPESACAAYDVQVIHPDEFLLDQLDLDPETVMAALRRQVLRYSREPSSVAALVDLLAKPGFGCPQFAESARALL